MKIEIHTDRELMQQLGPYGFIVITYYKAIYEKTGKLPSYTQTSKDLGIGYVKVRDALARVHNFIFLNNNKYSKYYKFIEVKSKEAYKTIKKRNKKKREEGKTYKGVIEERIWLYIINKVQPHFKEKIPTSFYWRTNNWISNLIEKLGQDKKKIDNYLQWFIYNKAKSIGQFNAGIFCCDKMIDEYLRSPNENNEITRKKIKVKKEEFKKKAEKQNQKLLDKIILKMKDGEELDRYDIATLKSLEKEGFYVR